MKRTCIITVIILCIAGALHSEDYQYQYFSKEKVRDKHLPFSDYIPQIRLHYQTVPHYLEDYYELYGMKMYYNENSLRKNIERLKTALQCKFRHPSQALVKIETEPEYFKYRNLLFMHINLLIMRSYLSIGARYDMRNIRFYHWDYAKDISDSLDTAERSYAEALPYWEKAREYADRASQVKITTDLGFIETERKKIILGDIDFGKIIADYRSGIRNKKNKLNELMAAYQKFQKKPAATE
ncbi:MAG TPA: hypothetical protein PLM53_19060 [Spirochaetota bacterium]|nr:hypothetical protein [Spirochaetota bacterium]HPC42879.1 hypothetical protein [Spirochaetota bacterium]HPL17116.1 hypothetical protein [Spirochaetota bacterium]HQF10338.1 hypothetical protein [Spirochaetota bacterium]HQH99197.1 hypothetical protein [Spirochaetota bacterium]